MITVVFIGGIRTHYIKINAIQNALSTLDPCIKNNFNFIFIDSGQHYDIPLNGFKSELGLHFDYTLTHNNKEPYNIACDIMQQLGDIFNQIQIKTKIDYVAVMGDVTTTIVSALAAVLKGIKVLHIESGARVKRGIGGEEYYRTATDHLASICFASTKKDLKNLISEGLGDHSFFVGDVMYDYMKDIANIECNRFLYFQNGTRAEFDCSSHDYVLSSLHHAENLTPEYLSLFFNVLNCERIRSIFIAHPRVMKILENNKINTYDTVIADYIPYKENLKAISNSRFIITDSGGIQREAYYLNIRCIVRSDMNIWQDLVECGSNYVAKQDRYSLIQAIKWASQNAAVRLPYCGCFGDGNSVQKMLQIVSTLSE